MSIIWKIKIGTDMAQPFTLYDMSCVLEFRSGDVDQATITVEDDMDSAVMFPHDESIEIIRTEAGEADEVFFRGTCKTHPADGDGSQESLSHTVVGPGYYLQRCTYEQRWKGYDSGTSSAQWQYKSRVILGQDEAGLTINIGEQIRDIVQFAIDRGAPIQLPSSISGWPTQELAKDEAHDIRCTDAINRLLAYVPDYRYSFDHNQSPPLFQLRKRSTTDLTSHPLTSLCNLKIRPRHDLTPVGIKIYFERATTGSDGTEYELAEVQEAGTTDSCETLVHTIKLDGAGGVGATQKIQTQQWPADMHAATWWQERCPALAAHPAANIMVETPTTDYADGLVDLQEDYPRFVTGGSIHDFMDVDPTYVTITAAVTVTSKDAAGLVMEQFVINQALKLLVINDDADFDDDGFKTYRNDGSSGGETPPASLAATLYAAWSQLQYDGSCEIIEDECSWWGNPGDVINISGGRTEWATMRAQVSIIRQELPSGRTVIQFGPDKHISPDDLAALLWNMNNRKQALGQSARGTGYSTDYGGSTNMGSTTPTDQVSSSYDKTLRSVLTDVDVSTEATRRIDLSPSAMPTDQGDLTMQPREVIVLESGEDAPEFRRRQYLASEAYGPELPELTIDPDTGAVVITPIDDGICDQNTHPGDSDFGDGDDGDYDDSHPGDGDFDEDDDYSGTHPGDNDCYTTHDYT